MKITKLSLIGAISAFTVVGGTVCLIYGLGDRSDKNYSETFINQKNIYRTYINNETGRASEPTIYQFNIDSNIQSYDTSNLASNYTQMSLPLMRLTRPYENRTTFTKDGNIEKEGSDLIRFEGAKKIFITYEVSGQEKKVAFSQEDINNKEKGIENFFKDESLKEGYLLKYISFSIKDDIYWVDSSGQKTNYKLTAKDYYYGLKSALLRDNLKLRLENGGKSELETGADLINGKDSNWDSSGNYYLFNVFSVDIKYNNIPLDNFPVEENTNNPLFRISMSEGNKKTPSFILDKLMFGMRIFLPSPSQYIQDVLEDERKGNLNLPNPGEKDAKKLGIYWYGRSLDYEYPVKTSEFKKMYGTKSPTRTLFVGPYIPGYHDDLRTEIVKNPNYWDQEWVKSKKTIEKYVTYYQKVDKEQFKKAQIDRYKLGYILSSDLGIMTEKEKNLVLQNPDKYGFGWTRTSNFKGNIGEIVRASFPIITLLEDINDNGYFNSEALNLVYGTNVTKTEIEKTIMEKKTDNYNPTIFDLDPKSTMIPTDQNNSFLNAIFATVNWENIIRNVEGLQKIHWSNFIPPTIDFLNGQKFINAEESKSYYINYKKNEIYFTSDDNRKINNISEAENVKSAKYDEVVNLINTIIEDAIKEGRIEENSTIKFNIPFRYSNASKKNDVLMKKVTEIINNIKLIKGVKLDVKYEKPTDLEHLRSLIVKPKNIFMYNKWGNDYESYSTYLAYYFLYNDGLYKTIYDENSNGFAAFLKKDETIKEALGLMKEISDDNPYFHRLFYNSLNKVGLTLKTGKKITTNDGVEVDEANTYLVNITSLLDYFQFISQLEKSKKDDIITKLKSMKFDKKDTYKPHDILIAPSSETKESLEERNNNYYNYWLDSFQGTLASQAVLIRSLSWETEGNEEQNKNTILYLQNMFGGSVDIANNVIDDLSKSIKTVKKSFLFSEKTRLEIPYLADWRII